VITDDQFSVDVSNRLFLSATRTILDAKEGQIQVKINCVDVFHPNTGEVRSDGAESIA